MDKKTKILFRLDEILKEQGRGVREVAKAAGLSISTISHIVNNRTRGISNDVLEKLCDELKIEPGEIYKKTKK